MKTVVCSMCGSTDIVKKGDLFVCQHCDTKFEGLEGLEGKDGSGSGEPSSDDPTINNYLVLAQAALDAGNISEAEGYLKTILEKDATQYEAWLLKGNAAGLSSTPQNPRLKEAVEYYVRALRYAPASVNKEMQPTISEMVVTQCQLKLREACDKFLDSGAPEDAKGIKSQIKDIQASLSVMQVKYNLLVRDISAALAVSVNKAAVTAYREVIRKRFQQTTRPGLIDFRKFTNGAWAVLELLSLAIDLSDHDAECDRKRYRSKINILNDLLNADFYGENNNKCCYNDQRLEEIRQLIAECEEKVKELDELLGTQVERGEGASGKAEAAPALPAQAEGKSGGSAVGEAPAVDKGQHEVPAPAPAEAQPNAGAANVNGAPANALSILRLTSFYVKFHGYAFLVLIPFALFSSAFGGLCFLVLVNLCCTYIGMKLIEAVPENSHTLRNLLEVALIFWVIGCTAMEIAIAFGTVL